MRSRNQKIGETSVWYSKTLVIPLYNSEEDLQSWYLILAKISISKGCPPSPSVSVEVLFLAKKSEVSFQNPISTSTLR